MIQSKPPCIGVVIVNLNSYEDTSRCLLSLGAITYENIRVILVDNGSHDGSSERLQREFHNILHIRLPENLGSTGGRNVGINRALEIGCDHVLLLDDDTIVTPGFLEPLVARLESDDTIAAVSGKIYFNPLNRKGETDIIWFAGCERKWHTWFNHRGMEKHDAGQFDNASPIPSMPACLMLIRGRVIKEIGAFSDDYFVYWEEADWCARAQQAGYRCFYEPKSVIVHNYQSGKPGKETSFYNYLQYRNALIYNAKHNSSLRQIQFFLALPILLLHRTLRSLRARNTVGARAAFWGIRDYFSGFRGKKGLLERGLLKQ